MLNSLNVKITEKNAVFTARRSRGEKILVGITILFPGVLIISLLPAFEKFYVRFPGEIFPS